MLPSKSKIPTPLRCSLIGTWLVVRVQIVNYSSTDPSNNPHTDPDLLKQYGFLGTRRVPTLIPNFIWGYPNSGPHHLTGKDPSVSE